MINDVIIARIKAILAAVAGIGPNVHDYVRVALTEAAFKELYFDAAAARYHGYNVSVESTESEDNEVHTAKDIHAIVIRGYMGVKDADGTEKLMRAEIETIRNTFATKRHLEDGGGVRYVYWCERMKMRLLGHAQFGNVLCHYAELTMAVQDYPLTAG